MNTTCESSLPSLPANDCLWCFAGAEFGIYCVNHLLLPMVQGWLRSTARRYRGWDSFATNFKQCCGLATDLVVFYHKHLPGEYCRGGGRLMVGTGAM